MFSDKCIIKYDPTSVKGNPDSMFKPWWLIGFTQKENELQEYYAAIIYKRTGIKLIKPAWGPHISIIRGEEPLNKELWKKYDGEEIEFIYDHYIKTNGGHWWLKVTCDKLLDIREELGLPRKHFVGLHFTIGTPKKTQKEESEYYARFLQKEN